MGCWILEAEDCRARIGERETGIESGEIELTADEVAERVLEDALQQLPDQIQGEKTRTGVDVLVAGHAGLPKPNTPSSLDIPFGSRQDAPMKRVFLQPR
ncbi:MAG: hypothetical protein LC114_15440 [Bryobacterales bacterium]|nr:hypothetical protein [Bryobacterales bacterium]